MNQLPTTPVSVLEKARDVAFNAGVKYVYIGNVPGHNAENTYCHKCKRMVLERRGFTILSNNIVHGRCKYCNENIPGVWS